MWIFNLLRSRRRRKLTQRTAAAEMARKRQDARLQKGRRRLG